MSSSSPAYRLEVGETCDLPNLHGSIPGEYLHVVFKGPLATKRVRKWTPSLDVHVGRVPHTPPFSRLIEQQTIACRAVQEVTLYGFPRFE